MAVTNAGIKEVTTCEHHDVLSGDALIVTDCRRRVIHTATGGEAKGDKSYHEVLAEAFHSRVRYRWLGLLLGKLVHLWRVFPEYLQHQGMNR